MSNSSEVLKTGEQLNGTLEYVSRRIEDLLKDAKEVSDGTNFNSWDEAPIGPETRVTIGYSKKPSHEILYRVRRDLPNSEDGYFRHIEYTWGGSTTPIFSKDETKKPWSSVSSPEDKKEQRDMESTDVTAISRLLDDYRDGKTRQKTETPRHIYKTVYLDSYRPNAKNKSGFVFGLLNGMKAFLRRRHDNA